MSNVVWRPHPREPCEYLHEPYIFRNYSHWPTFLSLIVVGSKNFLSTFQIPWVFQIYKIPWDFQVFQVFQTCKHPVYWLQSWILYYVKSAILIFLQTPSLNCTIHKASKNDDQCPVTFGTVSALIAQKDTGANYISALSCRTASCRAQQCWKQDQSCKTKIIRPRPVLSY